MAERDEGRLEVLRERSRAWRASNPERAKEIGRKAYRSSVIATAIAEGRDPNEKRSRRRLSDDERAANRKVLTDKHNAIKKAAAALLALADGREPGRIGRPPRLTDEERAAAEVKQNKRRSKRALARRTASRAADAIAEGREPGRVGQPRVLSDEERVLHKRANSKRSRQAHLEEYRAAEAKAARQKNAARALAEGRVPGMIGALARLTEPEIVAYLKAWPDKTSVFHARLKTQNSRAKRLGVEGTLTFVDLTKVVEEQRGYCAFCGNPFGNETPEIDHWVPLAIGGTNAADNVKLLHKRCNRTKGGRHPTSYGLTADSMDALLPSTKSEGV